MKRFAFLVGAVLLVFAVSIWAQAQAPMPDPELKKLGVLVGHWTYEGEYKAGQTGASGRVKGDDRIQWILNGFFLQELAVEKGAQGEIRSALIYGYDPTRKNIVWSGLGSDGGGGSGVIRASGNTITYDGKWSVAGKENFAKVTLVMSADLMSMAQKVEMSADGKAWTPFFEATYTKVRPAPKAK